MASSANVSSTASSSTEIVTESDAPPVTSEGGPSGVAAQPSSPPPKYFEENGLRFRIPSAGRDDYTHRRLYDLRVTPPQYGLFYCDPIRRNCYGEPDPNQSPVRRIEEVERERAERESRREAKRKREPSRERVFIPDIEPDEDGRVLGLPYSYGYLIDPPPTFDFAGSGLRVRPERPRWPRPEPEPEYESILFKRPRDEQQDVFEDRCEEQDHDQYMRENWHLHIDEEIYDQCYAPFCKEDFESKGLDQEDETKEVEGMVKDVKKRRLNNGKSISSQMLSVAWRISKKILKFLTSRMSN